MDETADAGVSALGADISAFLAARSTVYARMEALEAGTYGRVFSRNEIAVIVAPMMSRPTALAYFKDRDEAERVNQALKRFRLDAAFRATGPSPGRPQHRGVTVSMYTRELVDPAAQISELHRRLSKLRLELALAGDVEVEPAEALGMPAGSSRVDLALVSGKALRAQKMPPKRSRGDEHDVLRTPRNMKRIPPFLDSGDRPLPSDQLGPAPAGNPQVPAPGGPVPSADQARFLLDARSAGDVFDDAFAELDDELAGKSRDEH